MSLQKIDLYVKAGVEKAVNTFQGKETHNFQDGFQGNEEVIGLLNQ